MKTKSTAAASSSHPPSADGGWNPHQELYTRNRRIIAVELRTYLLWFIRLRWFVPFIISGIAGSAWGIGFRFNIAAVLCTAGFVLVYNFIFFQVEKRIRAAQRRSEGLNVLTYAQISLDYLALFILIHFTGGAAGPLIFLFIFHIIFASILLPCRYSYLFAAAAVLGIWAMAFCEMSGYIAYEPIAVRGEPIIFMMNPWYEAAMLAFFAGAIVATAVSTSAMMNVLKNRIIENAEYYERIDALTKERWRFMRKVAHNLRAPMVAVISMLDMVRNEYLGKLEPQQAEYLRRIDRRARHMTDLVNELMAIARSRTDTALPAPHPISVYSLAGRIANTFRDEAEQKGLTFTLEVDQGMADVQMDLELAEPILENLVSNAVKYTEKGEVRVSFAAGGADMIEITVQDEGIGIPEEDQSQLFREFFRAHNARAVEEVGTGLGLALVKETLDKNGGRIEFESAVQKGTTFRVYIPMSEDSENNR